MEPKPRTRSEPEIHQAPMITMAEKVETPQMLRVKSAESQHPQQNLTGIERARKSRNGQKRSTREILERIFSVIGDGESRSVSRIAKDVDAAWSTTYWLLDVVEFIQSKPRVVREGSMRRKRFYHVVGPRRR